jgi:hypothetical protein
MRKGILLGLVLGLMVLGTASVSSAQGGPVLEKIWAPAEVNWGKILKVYVKASDPEGDMKFVVVSAGKAGQAMPSGSTPIRLNKASRKSVNGYVYWDTNKAAQRDTAGIVAVQIEDMKGQESEVMTVNVKIVPSGAKVEQPPAEFQEIEIGPVMLDTIQRSY